MKGRALLAHPLLRPAAQELWGLGYSIRIIDNCEKIGTEDAIGAFDSDEKQVIIVRTHKDRKLTVGDMAFVLAHELRHAQHFELGLYKNYYHRESIMRYKDLPSFVGVGYRAELDCDQYAREYLRKFGGKSRFSHRKYPKRKVAMYVTYKRFLSFREYARAVDNTMSPDEIRKKRRAYEKWANHHRKN